jgi:hypothetical protein
MEGGGFGEGKGKMRGGGAEGEGENGGWGRKMGWGPGHISLLCSLSAWPSSSSRRQRAGRPSSCAAAWPLPPPPPPRPPPQQQQQPRLRRRRPPPPSRPTSSRTSCRSASPPSSASSGSSGTSRDTRRSSARWPGRCACARAAGDTGFVFALESRGRRPKQKLTPSPSLPHRPRAQIAGLSVNEAIAQLAFSPSRRAASVRKAITRATQQADMRHQLPQVRPHVVPALPSTLLPVSPPHPPPPTTRRAGQAHD